MHSVILEIRPGEGGDDAKMLVSAHAQVYMNYASKHGLTCVVAQEHL